MNRIFALMVGIAPALALPWKHTRVDGVVVDSCSAARW